MKVNLNVENMGHLAKMYQIPVVTYHRRWVATLIGWVAPPFKTLAVKTQPVTVLPDTASRYSTLPNTLRLPPGLFIPFLFIV